MEPDNAKDAANADVSLTAGNQVLSDSQTASEFINQQLELEADAREVLPYKFDSCSRILGPMRQSVFACLTCSPPPASAAQVYTPAGVCYSCSIACHGDHTLVELFNKRNFVCDCGTTRMPATSLCKLSTDQSAGRQGVHSRPAAEGNHYNQNFQNRFCGCGEEYDVTKERGTMFQCLGLGTVETGGCGEDWWHPECLMGLPRGWYMQSEESIQNGNNGKAADDEGNAELDQEPPIPPGFPPEDAFDYLLCYKCVESNPWIKAYAGTTGFLPPVFKRDHHNSEATNDPAIGAESATEARIGLKRKAADDDDEPGSSGHPKRMREETETTTGISQGVNGDQVDSRPQHKHELLPPARKEVFSLFLEGNFREHLCHCPQCYPNLIPHQQLIEEEETYEPPLSDSAESDGAAGSGARSHGTGSLLERGEVALSTLDRVRAIEGVMVYNHLKEKVKDFLRPYAESGKPVGAEDIKAYFEKLRGDDAAIREAGSRPLAGHDEDEANGDKRREQSGY